MFVVGTHYHARVPEKSARRHLFTEIMVTQAPTQPDVSVGESLTSLLTPAWNIKSTLKVSNSELLSRTQIR